MVFRAVRPDEARPRALEAAHRAIELFLFDPENRLIAAEVRTDESFEEGTLRPLFQAEGSAATATVANDGRRFLVTSALPQAQSPIAIVTHWTAALREK